MNLDFDWISLSLSLFFFFNLFYFNRNYSPYRSYGIDILFYIDLNFLLFNKLEIGISRTR